MLSQYEKATNPQHHQYGSIAHQHARRYNQAGLGKAPLSEQRGSSNCNGLILLGRKVTLVGRPASTR